MDIKIFTLLLSGLLLWFEMGLTLFWNFMAQFLQIFTSTYLIFSCIFQMGSATASHCIWDVLGQLQQMSSKSFIWGIFWSYIVSSLPKYISKFPKETSCVFYLSLSLGSTNSGCSINVFMTIIGRKLCLHQFAPHSHHRETQDGQESLVIIPDPYPNLSGLGRENGDGESLCKLEKIVVAREMLRCIFLPVQFKNEVTV